MLPPLTWRESISIALSLARIRVALALYDLSKAVAGGDVREAREPFRCVCEHCGAFSTATPLGWRCSWCAEENDAPSLVT